MMFEGEQKRIKKADSCIEKNYNKKRANYKLIRQNDSLMKKNRRYTKPNYCNWTTVFLYLIFFSSFCSLFISSLSLSSSLLFFTHFCWLFGAFWAQEIFQPIYHLSLNEKRSKNKRNNKRIEEQVNERKEINNK